MRDGTFLAKEATKELVEKLDVRMEVISISVIFTVMEVVVIRAVLVL